MKNLLAAIITAIILFFLASCSADGALPQAESVQSTEFFASEVTSVPSTAPISPLAFTSEAPQYVALTTLSAGDISLVDTDAGINAVDLNSITIPTDNGKATVKIEDFGLSFKLAENPQSDKTFLKGFDIEGLYWGNTLKAEGDLDIYATGNRSAMLIKQGDLYLAYFENGSCRLTPDENFDELYCGFDAIYYVKQTGDKVEVGTVSDGISSGYSLEKSFELSVLQKNSKYRAVAGNGYLSNLRDDGESLYFEQNEYIDSIYEYLSHFAAQKNIDSDDIALEVVMKTVPVSAIYEVYSYIPSELYYNNTLLCEPLKLLNDHKSACIEVTVARDTVVINYNNIEDIFFHDRLYWFVIDGKLVKLNQTVKRISLDENGDINFYRLADGLEHDYLFYKVNGPQEYPTFTKLCEALTKAYGDRAPDVEAPYYEYGKIVCENGKAIFKSVTSVTIRELYAAAHMISSSTPCC